MMQEITKRITGRVAVRLFSLPVEDYIISVHFSRFYREQDLEDIWKESRERSRERPDLYGDAMIKNAFVEFLYHTFHSRPEEFPAIVTRFLTGFSWEISRPLPLDELKKDLMDLGCPAEDLEKTFTHLRAIEEEQLKRSTTGCPD